MELIGILRILARRRIAVVVGALAAALCGLWGAGAVPAGGSSRAATHGIAQSRVFVDTTSSYAGDLRGGTEALGTQAALLGALIAGQPQKVAIARRAGVPVGGIEILVRGITDPKVPSTLVRSAAPALASPRRAHSIVARVDSAIAIVTFEAAAPTAAAAARLAQAAVDVMRATSAARAPSARRSLVVDQLGPVHSLTATDADPRGPLLGGAIAVALFAAWCSAIVVGAGITRAWRPLRRAGAG